MRIAIILVVAGALGALIVACGSDGDVDDGAATIRTALAMETAMADPTRGAMLPGGACAGVPIDAATGTAVQVRASGGWSDTFDAHRAPDGTSYLQLVVDGVRAFNFELTQSPFEVMPIGGLDVDGDGRDELFVNTGRGASTAWIDVFTFDEESCELVRLAEPGDNIPQFTVGASVGAGSGLECADGGFVAIRFARSGDEDVWPATARVWRTTYAIRDGALERTGETEEDVEMEAVLGLATFECGALALR